MNGKNRCGWCGADPLYVAYHDEEWGVPVRDDRTLFEFLILEGAQAGLSWSTILNKRQGYRRLYDGFDPELVARYGETKVAELLTTRGKLKEARKEHELAVEAREAHLSPSHPIALKSRRLLDNFIRQHASVDEIERRLLDAVAAAEEAAHGGGGKGQDAVVAALQRLADHYKGSGRNADALLHLARALTLARALDAAGKGGDQVGGLLNAMSHIHYAAGRLAEAHTLLSEAVRRVVAQQERGEAVKPQQLEWLKGATKALRVIETEL